MLCQGKAGDDIVRVVQSGRQCVKETVSIFRGSVEKSEPVRCERTAIANALHVGWIPAFAGMTVEGD
ncbi:hypothetical protein [Hyphomicrobium sp. 99]|uniref:hypothetical protein n=1 Tax=Hyphomicrobium sp. 99 TaxID=1163419 RepID=UPI0005F84F7A|nr:hypothetical protein [Hyphomicrobium sp. 99]